MIVLFAVCWWLSFVGGTVEAGHQKAVGDEGVGILVPRLLCCFSLCLLLIQDAHVGAGHQGPLRDQPSLGVAVMSLCMKTRLAAPVQILAWIATSPCTSMKSKESTSKVGTRSIRQWRRALVFLSATDKCKLLCLRRDVEPGSSFVGRGTCGTPRKTGTVRKPCNIRTHGTQQ